MYGKVNPHSHQRLFSINVWAGMIGDHLPGPYLLPKRLDGNKYLTFLQQMLPEMLNDVPAHIRQVMWFQQDGAPAHYAQGVSNYLDVTFPNKWIGRGGSVSWPPCSSDLSCLNFLWGQLKGLMYKTPFESSEELFAKLSAAAGEVRDMPGVS